MSESEEMYLVTIARLGEAGYPSPVGLAEVAAWLEIQPVSANQMVRRLEEAGLVRYTPYKGVALTEEGERQAARILRQRRLWEVFLAEKLGFAAQDAERMACRLEHLLEEEAVERLSEYLGAPAVSPQGMHIPGPVGGLEAGGGKPLGQARVGETSRVRRVRAEGAGRSFLMAQGIAEGMWITVQARGEGGETLVQTQAGKLAQLSAGLAGEIWIEAGITESKELN